MPGLSAGAEGFAILSQQLKDAGSAGLRRELYKAISKAAEDLAAEIRSPDHLYPYMPNHYADVLAGDLSVRVYKRGGSNAHVQLAAKGRVHERKVIQLDNGILMHPVFGKGGIGGRNPERKKWNWVTQTASVKPGFFTDPVERSAPQIRDRILAAMHETALKITSGR